MRKNSRQTKEDSAQVQNTLSGHAHQISSRNVNRYVNNKI